MRKINIKSNSESTLDLEHELPATEAGDGNSGGIGNTGAASEGGEQPAADGELQAEVQKLRAERDSLYDRLARAQAEFDNARRRANKEQQDFRDYATVDLIKPLLPVMDSFDRALTVQSDAADFRSGVELIYKQLLAALAKLGVTPIEARGQTFDPHIHEAIEMVETSEAADQEVLDELQRGYKFKERLLRPAMVKVAKNSGK